MQLVNQTAKEDCIQTISRNFQDANLKAIAWSIGLGTYEARFAKRPDLLRFLKLFTSLAEVHPLEVPDLGHQTVMRESRKGR